MNVPKIIHQTWRDTDLPYHFQILSNTWKEHNPEWSYRFWTDESIRAFIKLNFPYFLNKFDNYSRQIQRVDVFRYFLLKKFGGLYVDIDFECLCNIESVLKDHHCVIGKEPLYHCQRFSKEMILCNAFIASTPENGFIKHLCQRVQAFEDISVKTPIDVLNSTGPFILTDAYYEYKDKEDVHLLESSEIYPITLQEKQLVLNGAITDELQKRIDKASAVHYFWGTW